MRYLPLSLLLVLTTACSGGSTPPAADSTTPTPSATATTATAVDPFDAIEPPTSPGVGSFDAVLANHAYAATRGYLALELLEASSITGANNAALVEQLQGATGDLTVKADLGGAPTRRGLDYRPLFPRTATVPKPVGTVGSSIYTADEVRGLGGEQGLRVSWTGTITYPVTLGGKTSPVGYTTTMGYVFSTVPNDPAGMVLQQVVKGTASFTGVIAACAAKGVLYPGTTGAACPV
jgi:hypothetical protein